MRRREFITLLSSAAAARPVGARAQQLGTKMARIGLLMPVSAASAAQNVAALRRVLSELGYVEGQNIGIEERYTDGRDELLPELAAELVTLDVDIIVTWGTGATRAAQQATLPKEAIWVAAIMRAGGAYGHSRLMLATLSEEQEGRERRSDR
jgi:putative ABC transport system substrate-binding protein